MIDNILLGLMVLTTVGTLSFFFYTLNVYEKPLPSNAAEQQALMEDAKKRVFSEAFKMDKLIVNLKSRTSRLRFLDIEAYLVPFKNRYTDIFEEKKAIINDIIIDEASQIAPEELNTVSGKLIFESRLRKRINDNFKAPLVKDIFFSRFVVQ